MLYPAIIETSPYHLLKPIPMKYELVYSTDFTQAPLYKTLVTFVGSCNEVIPKMTCQGRKLFAGRIR
jgi:hypothetical protein